MTDLGLVFRGIIRGKLIELEKDPGLRDGDPVEVPIALALPPGEGLRRAAGGWDEEGLTLDQLLEEIHRIRKGDRPEAPA